jgi:hypothetical protein
MPESRDSEASYDIVIEECGRGRLEKFKIDVTLSKEVDSTKIILASQM